MNPALLFKDVTKDQVQQVYNLAPAGLLGQIVIVLLATYAFSKIADLALLSIWCLVQCGALIYRGWATLAYRRQVSLGSKERTKWASRYLLAAISSGLAWGGAIILLQTIGSPEFHYFILACALGLAGGSIVTLGAIFPIYAGFVLPMLGLLAGWFLLHPDDLHTVTGLCTLFASGYLLYTAQTHEQSILKVINQNRDIQDTQLEIVRRLGRAGEYRDNDTGQHVIRMSRSCQFLALHAGLGEEFAETLLYASPMHDVGKIGIPDHILLKPGKLDEEEWRIMKTHATIGAAILDGHDSKIMRMATSIAATHHEKWDGSGYPKGITGEEIPIEGRIAAICDVFDALTCKRPYKEAWPYDKALTLIQEGAGSHFDPHLVEHFMAISTQVIALKKLHPDTDQSDLSEALNPQLAV
jgi:hypothetical protein